MHDFIILGKRIKSLTPGSKEKMEVTFTKNLVSWWHHDLVEATKCSFCKIMVLTITLPN